MDHWHYHKFNLATDELCRWNKYLGQLNLTNTVGFDFAQPDNAILCELRGKNTKAHKNKKRIADWLPFYVGLVNY